MLGQKSGLGLIRWVAAAMCVLAAMWGISAYAADEPVDATAPPKAIYLPLKPAFVVNYGGVGRLRYLKIDLTARLANAETAAAVLHHLPYIRNNLVRLFASQTDETLDSQEGKEALRQDALKEIRAIIKAEADLEGVEDVFFNNLIIQK